MTASLSRLDPVSLWVTRILNPAVLAILTFGWLGYHDVSTWPDAVWAMIWGPGMPTAYAVGAVLLGRSDTVFLRRRQRVVPLGVAALACTVGVWHVGGQADLVLLLRAYGMFALFSAGVSWWWSISLHAAGAAIPFTYLVGTGQGLGVGVAVAILVGWARLHRKEHSLGQVVAGFCGGVAAYAASYTITIG